MKKGTPDLVGKIREQYVSFRASVAQSIDNTYENLGKQISAQLDSYYTEQIASAKEQVEQSALVARQDAQQKEEIRGVIAHIRALLADLEITG